MGNTPQDPVTGRFTFKEPNELRDRLLANRNTSALLRQAVKAKGQRAVAPQGNPSPPTNADLNALLRARLGITKEDNA